VTDGTGAGTQRLADINPGVPSSSPTDITALGNGRAVLYAFDATDGGELWVTDGTQGGTQRVKDINQGSGSSYVKYLTPLGNGKAIFEAHDGKTTYPHLVGDRRQRRRDLPDLLRLRPGRLGFARQRQGAVQRA
jgi:ELWxxDGT repeat protein